MFVTIEWMGRYRPLVAALLQHANLAARIFSCPYEVAEGLMLKPHAWQVMEYLIEHETEIDCMNRVSEAVGIPQSSFSRIARELTDLGLVERYHTSANRKNVILIPTSRAHEVYLSHSRQFVEQIFQGFFDRLDRLDDDSILLISEALGEMNQTISQLTTPSEEIRLIKTS